ncbi:hypothetical protein Leryth_020075 [Lithospermum erythrorhizon]|nr:hypothetical protein Leryth_020075 [Lithospermum erythrorhizon]
MSAIYYVWVERCSRCYGLKARLPEVVLRKVFRTVQQRASSWRGVVCTKENWMFSLEWSVENVNDFPVPS